MMLRRGRNGKGPPVCYIQGHQTQVVGTGYGALDAVTVDGVNNEIFLPVASNSVLVFDRSATGDVAPKRVLHGPDTQIQFAAPGDRGALPAVGVDPMHNLLIVPNRNSLLIFD